MTKTVKNGQKTVKRCKKVQKRCKLQSGLEFKKTHRDQHITPCQTHRDQHVIQTMTTQGKLLHQLNNNKFVCHVHQKDFHLKTTRRHVTHKLL